METVLKKIVTGITPESMSCKKFPLITLMFFFLNVSAYSFSGVNVGIKYGSAEYNDLESIEDNLSGDMFGGHFLFMINSYFDVDLSSEYFNEGFTYQLAADPGEDPRQVKMGMKITAISTTARFNLRYSDWKLVPYTGFGIGRYKTEYELKSSLSEDLAKSLDFKGSDSDFGINFLAGTHTRFKNLPFQFFFEGKYIYIMDSKIKSLGMFAGINFPVL